MSSAHAVDGAREDAPPPLVSRFTQALEDYQRSNRTFQVLSTLNAEAPATPPKTILILDSSFNPPTLAHKSMALSALYGDGRAGSSSSSSSRILLLLAINNADKAPKPAAFPQRLAMMQAFGDDLLADVAAADPRGDRYGCGGVDVAVTTEPYFHAKAAAVAAAGPYRASEQVYLTGFDTLIRIFDPKYYGGGGSMAAALDPFFARARLRVTMRTDAEWGGAAEQEAYLEELRRGGLERVGGRTGWAERIEMVAGEKAVVSSTKVREAVRRRDWDALKKLVSGDVADWIRDQGLYAGASV
ncbi:Nucleotidylyl transferase [Hypoxylon cercidicola]|nr:Nucleotidylyl transferase [Hypoxylon cercidicola]